jgi:formate hydrogenlyase subunit 6/NADH:ubiquinone oxidoreductase subunit I
VKEAINNLFNVITIDYPAGAWPGKKYSHLPDTYRGKHKFDDQKCIGCGACSVCCSSAAITLNDGSDKREVSVFLGKCIFCARCQDVCPTEALKLTSEFELAYAGRRDSDDAFVKISRDFAKCANCGRPFIPKLQIDFANKNILEKIDPKVKDTVAHDLNVFSNYCADCRRLKAYEWNTHVRKYY